MRRGAPPSTSTKQQNDEGHYSRVERVSGKFARTFTLPENVQTDAIKAQFKDGVLELTIPKSAKAEPRKIEVQAA
jgi:HSP20 family protein